MMIAEEPVDPIDTTGSVPLITRNMTNNIVTYLSSIESPLTAGTMFILTLNSEENMYGNFRNKISNCDSKDSITNQQYNTCF